MEGEIWELADAHCALLQGLQKTQHRCLEPPGEARPRGSAAEKPQPPAQVTGQPLGPAQGSLGPCSQEMPVEDTVGALGDPPASRPSDVFSIKGDVITGAMTPLHAVLGQPKVSFQQPPCPRWVTLFIHVGGGEGRGKQSSPPDRCKHQGTPDLPPSLQGPPAGRGPVYWVVETVSGQWRSMPFSHRMMLCVCVCVCVCARHVCTLSRFKLFATPRTETYQAPLSMGFSRPEYWTGLPFASPGDLLDPAKEKVSCTGKQVLHRLSHHNANIPKHDGKKS